ncbi:MAG: hypothetical protein PVI59_04535, partial [Anaerolineae bacterium]
SKREGTNLARRTKFLLQSVALILMLVVPVLLYWAARFGGEGLILALLGVMAAAMGLTIWVS